MFLLTQSQNPKNKCMSYTCKVKVTRKPRRLCSHCDAHFIFCCVLAWILHLFGKHNLVYLIVWNSNCEEIAIYFSLNTAKIRPFYVVLEYICLNIQYTVSFSYVTEKAANLSHILAFCG